jgi:hypothetical protein
MNDEQRRASHHLRAITLKYQPLRGAHWRIAEAEEDYIARMRTGPLPNWPTEPLKEWLNRHAQNMEDYAFLGF